MRMVKILSEFSSQMVQFIFTITRPGTNDVEHMKQLAEEGEGLNSFISRVVRKRYAAKERSCWVERDITPYRRLPRFPSRFGVL